MNEQLVESIKGGLIGLLTVLVLFAFMFAFSWLLNRGNNEDEEA